MFAVLPHLGHRAMTSHQLKISGNQLRIGCTKLGLRVLLVTLITVHAATTATAVGLATIPDLPAVRPPPIEVGDPIRVIAPAGAVDATALARGTALLGTAPFGLQVRQDLGALLAVEMYYAGSDDVRVGSLLGAVTEMTVVGNNGTGNGTPGTKIKAVWAARGQSNSVQSCPKSYLPSVIFSGTEGHLLSGE